MALANERARIQTVIAKLVKHGFVASQSLQSFSLYNKAGKSTFSHQQVASRSPYCGVE